jgi:hypothetical protein
VGFGGSDTMDAGKLDLMLLEMESTSVKLNPSYVLKEIKKMHMISEIVTNMYR